MSSFYGIGGAGAGALGKAHCDTAGGAPVTFVFPPGILSERHAPSTFFVHHVYPPPAVQTAPKVQGVDLEDASVGNGKGGRVGDLVPELGLKEEQYCGGDADICLFVAINFYFSWIVLYLCPIHQIDDKA